MIRISWIDRWRGFLIISIVMFHVVGVGIITGDYRTVQFLNLIKTFISSYHVVSFFVIAALLDLNTNVSFGSFLAKKARRLLVPYVIFGLAMAVVFYLAKSYTGGNKYYSELHEFAWYDPLLAILHGGGWPEGVSARVLGPLWFLPCFFSAQVIFYFVNKICDNFSKWCCAAALFLVVRVILVWCAYGFNPFGVGMAIEFVVLMCIFRGLSLKFDFVKDTRLHSGYFILSLVCLLVGCMRSFPYSPMVAVCNRAFSSIFAVVGSAMIVKIIDSNILAFIGKYSLGIFLFHKFFIVALQATTGDLAFCFRNGVGISIASIVAITCIVVCASIVATVIIRKTIPFAIGESRSVKDK